MLAETKVLGFIAEYWAVLLVTAHPRLLRVKTRRLGEKTLRQNSKKYENGHRSSIFSRGTSPALCLQAGRRQSISELSGMASGCFEESGGATAVADA